jgi:hypothetical protein
MKTGNILLATLAGTASMTLFSYLISNKKNKDFKEPQLLGKMVYRAVPEIKKDESKVAGWILHVGAGLFFVLAYKLLLDNTKLKSNVPEGVLLGFANGAVAVAIWKATFSLHPDPPEIHFKDFYGHLVITHVFFCVPALLILNKNKQQANKS